MPTYYPKIDLCSIATAERIQPAAVRTDVERHKSFKFIYEVCLRPDANATSACTIKMQWRAVGGTWADLTSAGALKYTTGTVLVNDNTLAAENCIYDGVPTFEYVEGKECTDGQVAVPALAIDQYTQIQYAVDPADATDGTEYEFQFINTTDSNSVVPQYSTGIDNIPEYIAHAPVTRYWVGGTGYWNYVAHWSETSGGSPYATAPMEMDTVVFDENCGGGMVTHLEGYQDIHCHFVTTGIPSGMELRVFVNRITLISDLTGFDKLTFLECTLNTNNYDINVSTGIMFGQSGDVGTYNLGTSTITVANAPSPGYITAHADGTLNATDAKFVMQGGNSSAASPASISFGSKSIGELNVQFDVSSNKITVNANATIGILSVAGDGLLSSSSTFAVSESISIEGDTEGGLSIAGLDFSMASGTVNANNCAISNSTASGGASFLALTNDGNVDGGSNTGWVFGSSVPPLVELVLEAFSPAMINRITLPAGNLELQSFAPLGGVSRVYIPAASLLLQTFGVETNVNNRLKYIGRTSIVFEDRASIVWEKEALAQHAIVPASELVLTGYGPATIGGVITSRVPVSSLLLSPHSPLGGVSRIVVASSSLILTPFAPTGISIIPALIPAGSLVLQAFAPHLIERVSIPAASLILTPFAPGVVQNVYAHIPAVNLVLTAWAPRASIVQYASIPAGSLVLQGFAPLYIWTPSRVHLVTLQNIYLCILTGAADGVDDITIPISSFQSTMRDGDPSYLACVIPNSVDYVAAIAARPNGDIVIRKGYKFSDGSTQTEEIIRVDYESLQVNRGARSDSATISGHKTTSSSNPKSVNLSGVSYYGLQADGKRTFRADPDLFLRVGDTAVYGAESLVVDQISYTVGDRQAIMQVTEA